MHAMHSTLPCLAYGLARGKHVVGIYVATSSFCAVVHATGQQRNCKYLHVRASRTGTHLVCLGLARTMYIRCIYGTFGRENHQIYGHIRNIYTVLDNPTYVVYRCRGQCRRPL